LRNARRFCEVALFELFSWLILAFICAAVGVDVGVDEDSSLPALVIAAVVFVVVDFTPMVGLRGTVEAKRNNKFEVWCLSRGTLGDRLRTIARSIPDQEAVRKQSAQEGV